MSTVKFKGFRIGVEIRDPEEAENFLRGLIIAKSNNSSPFFQQLIDGINTGLESHRAAVLEEQMRARAEAGMP